MDKDRLELLRKNENYIPPIHSLAADERKEFFSQFEKKTSIDSEQLLSGELCHKILYQKNNILPILHISEANEQEILKFFLAEHDLHDKFVYLNYFYNTGDIDKIAAAELADNFTYYWYPAVDDLLIISQSFDWIIGISHDGALYFQKYYSRQTTLGADNE